MANIAYMSAIDSLACSPLSIAVTPPRKIFARCSCSSAWGCQANVAELLIDDGCTSLPLLNSRVRSYGTKFTKFLHDVAKLLHMNLLKSLPCG